LQQQWKESIITPIYKKSDKSDCSNYRGISLLPTTYKTLSNALISGLTPYVEVIEDHQYEFESIDQQLIRYSIHHLLEKKWKYNRTVQQLFVGFEKACDSVKEVLYSILTECGIPMKFGCLKYV
jgi:hypothetical protein